MGTLIEVSSREAEIASPHEKSRTVTYLAGPDGVRDIITPNFSSMHRAYPMSIEYLLV